jgi:cyclopropane fatty-acyl-phospholipid synthase-like methyltransferase
MNNLYSFGLHIFLLSFLMNLHLDSVAQSADVIEPDIFYVPTPADVVDAMLNLAEVGPDDVVYDLGSGDGRIVIAAARDYNASGVGIEIDPKYIQQSRENAITDGVQDKVTFIQGDLFEVDISEATVVAIYLSEELNLRLRPRLLAMLNPGTRIISHEFTLGNWEPEQNLVVGGHKVYLWIVP